MKFINYCLLLLTAGVLFTSCLKSKNDVGGLLNDEGSIVTSITQAQYLSNDRTSPNTQFGYQNANANFNLFTRPNESVYFFNVVVSQPRDKKISGPLTLSVTTSDYDGDPTAGVQGYSPTILTPAAGAINVTSIVIPESKDQSITVPVFFTVNKTLLPAPGVGEAYGIKFTLSSASQGIISQGDKSINVLINYSEMNSSAIGATDISSVSNSDIQGIYNWHTEFVDPAGQYGIVNNARRYVEQLSTTTFGEVDNLLYGYGSYREYFVAYNLATGVQTNIFTPRFTFNASGQITAVANGGTSTAVSNFQIDPSGDNKITYVSNNDRKISVRYTFTLTTTFNGVVTPRTIRVFEEFSSYNNTQIYF